jgi:hypothetical protein
MPRTAATGRTRALPNAAKFTAVRPLIAHANASTQEACITNWYYIEFLEGHFARSTAPVGNHTIPQAARFCEQKTMRICQSARAFREGPMQSRLPVSAIAGNRQLII